MLAMAKEIVLTLNKRNSTKKIIENIQHLLTLQIIETNKKTADEEEGKRLYRELMQEE